MLRKVVYLPFASMPGKINWDLLGIGASVLCAIHCAILPLALVSLPILGVNIIHNPSFEYGMIALAFVVGTLALLHGFRHHHRHPGPWLLFTAGLLLLVAKQVWHQYELRILPFAVILVIAAHVVNYRLSRPIGVDARPSADVSEMEAGRERA